MVKFQLMKFQFDKIHISGGHNTKPMPANVIVYDDASRGTTATFVKLVSTEA